MTSRAFVIVVFVAGLLGSTSALTRSDGDATVVQNATWQLFNGTAMAGQAYQPQVYVLDVPAGINASEVEDYLLLVGVELLVRDGDGAAVFDGTLSVMVSTSSGVALGVTELEAPFASERGGWAGTSAMFCWSNAFAAQPPDGYIVQVLPPAFSSPSSSSNVTFLNAALTYRLLTALLQRQLVIDGPAQLDAVQLATSYWFFDVDGGTERAPLQLTVHRAGSERREQHSNELAVYLGCPGQLTPGLQNNIRPVALASFDRQARVTFSKGEGASALLRGRYYVLVHKSNASEALDLRASVGMAYDRYPTVWGLTVLVYLLACPLICAVTFFLIWYAQPLRSRTVYGPQDSLLPDGAYDASFVDDHQEYDDDDDDDDDDDGDGERTTLLAPAQTQQFQTLAPVSGVRYWETTMFVALIFFTPAVQLVISELMRLNVDGDWDTCYFNDLCVRPSYASGLLIVAFNNVYSNVGYVVAGLTLFVYLVLLRRYVPHLPKFMPSQYSVLWALCLCLVAVGVNSAVYHLCPSRIGFQVDSAQMLAFALLSIADIYRRNFQPDLESWSIFMLLAVILLLNYVGTIIDTYPTIADDRRVHDKVVYLAVLTVLLSLGLLAFCAWIWRRPNTANRKSFVVLAVVLAVPTIGLLWWRYDQDLSQSLLAIFVVAYALCVAADFAAQLGFVRLIERCELPRVCRCCPQGTARSCFADRSLWRRLRTSLLILWLAGGWLTCGLFSLHYFVVEDDTDKNLSPAQSRNLNQPCRLADYYSTHDVWHFVSALWLTFQVLINAHIGHGLKNSRLFYFKDEVLGAPKLDSSSYGSNLPSTPPSSQQN